MRRFPLAATAFILLALPLHAQTNAAFLNQIAHARFIMVTTDQGDPTEGRGTTEDQRAVVKLQNAIQEWKRFTLTWNKRDADIILVIRTGRIASATGGVVVNRTNDPRRQTPQSTLGMQIGAEMASTGDDIFSVYDASNFPDSTVLWRAHQKNGLAGKKMALFEQFKKDVEEADAKAGATSKKP